MPKPESGKIDRPPRKGLKGVSGKDTDNPKLPRQATGGGDKPSATGKSKPHEGIKRGG